MKKAERSYHKVDNEKSGEILPQSGSEKKATVRSSSFFIEGEAVGKLKIYEVDRAYTDYLRKFDDRIPEEKAHIQAKTRKYVGLLFEINSCKYFAPLSSPKKKFKTMKNDKDFLKIEGGRYGAINFNNMFPVHDDAIKNYNINAEPDKKYQIVLKKQAIFIRKNKDNILRNARELYDLMTEDNEEFKSERSRLEKRCCRFKLLEEKSKMYGSSLSKV
ncbi:type III toxin-antitoxin system ToxN/AbiQ family toxin [Paenibacillus woosongensis]|uniref:Type III toxin-antitoxin system ToxN/AbiQ family toxin n=1 Tax=Paenibacillus woosongensis TaxID=307580 RepID=A0AA95I3S8_9BACL|nr:type III toxin-antitoxin system ToxN/AbiQ family toxin [Paenibacillus woosongensis]WHX49305.1 type III toxin-antitoxin system ToxN/AbiQ family toxin [Paenibacillus woosongensis]